MVEQNKLERKAILTVRTYPETKEKLKRYTKLKGDELGTRITQGQGLEILLAHALGEIE